MIDCSLVTRAMTGCADECGDVGLIRECGSCCYLALIDGLGHGGEARCEALLAREYILAHLEEDLAATMLGLHLYLQGGRGVVAALCRLRQESGELEYCGVGNICLRIFGPRSRRLWIRDGVLGYLRGAVRSERLHLLPGDILVMSSDGIREHFDPVDYVDLFYGDACSISRGLLAQLGRDNDDASCLVLRYCI